MAMDLYGSASFTGGNWSLNIPEITESGSLTVWVFRKPAVANVATPSGFNTFFVASGVDSGIRVFTKAVTATAAYTMTGTTTVGGVAAGDGVVGYILSDKDPVDFALGSTDTPSGNQYTETHTAPEIECEIGDIIVSGVCNNQFPREYSTTDTTEKTDKYAPYGPAAATGSMTAVATTAGPFEWTSADPADAGASGSEQSISFTIRYGSATPVDIQPTLTGGGEIPIIDVKSVTWPDLSGLDLNSNQTVEITVIGDDDAPFTGVPVTFSVSGGGNVSPTSATTDASGKASTALSTTLAGNWFIRALIGSTTYSKAFSVDGSSLQIAAPSSVLLGNTIEIVITAKDDDGAPLVGADVYMFVRGQPFDVVSSGDGETDGAGRYSYVIRPTASGLIYISAEVDGIDSPEVGVQVNEPDVVEDQYTILRGISYLRPRPRNT